MNYSLNTANIDSWAEAHKEFFSRMQSMIATHNYEISREYREAAENLEFVKSGRCKLLALLQSINETTIATCNEVEIAQAEIVRGGDKDTIIKEIAALEDKIMTRKHILSHVDSQLGALSRDIVIYEEQLLAINSYLSQAIRISEQLEQIVMRDSEEIEKLYTLDIAYRNMRI